MCGIVGYTGFKDCASILLKGLKCLEYRGYDSWGFSFLKDENLVTIKKAGKISEAEEIVNDFPRKSFTGIAHTRWATHGFPTDINAHPHFDCRMKIAVVHNGIIENYLELKKELQKEGHIFRSETDTEVIPHLIEKYYQEDILSAIRKAMLRLVGAFGLAIISTDEPNILYGARRGSPLIVGVGDKEMFLSSDINALVTHTRKVIYLDEDEVVKLTPTSFEISTLKEEKMQKEIHTISLDAVSLGKGGLPHFMLKEIFEQPESLHNAFRGRLDYGRAISKLGGLELTQSEMLSVRGIKLLGCGTSWHAALIGKYLFEELARIPAEVDYSSEFRYRDPILLPDTLVIAISQSGETADTLAAMKEAKRKGAKVLGICNVVGSSIARECGRGVYLHAGPEIGVASTKAFTSQLVVLTLLALLFARMKGVMARREGLIALNAIEALPCLAKRVLKKAEKVEKIADLFYRYPNFLYVGRGYQFPIALEGALKLKEISYVHAEGIPAAELKHGPIALIDENMPTVVLATESNILDKVKSNVAEIKARKGKIISIVTEASREMDDLSDFKCSVPPTPHFLAPILSVIPLQLLAYYIATCLGCDVDKPRNLAKSVTVE
ncbi:glutamine--fructose-6-phosphate transaminase (isomerizing) [Candidatus Aerophobetes bacterium]|nr:glutamine--fructose-6-phosphate transaminase (isomerizing) [Candidatus Aerophobetes bacterium]